jgi:predicted phosphoribosyltransferase
VFVVRTLGVPGSEELAMGAIASGGLRVLNEAVVRRLGIPTRVIEAVTREQQKEVERREQVCRGRREPIQIQHRKVMLVDDGLATGATMRAAARALRLKNPASAIIAVPVGSPDTCEQLRAEVDELVCGQTPEPFFAIGTWYSNFLQVTDEEVRQLLDQAARERPLRPAQDQTAFAE